MNRTLTGLTIGFALFLWIATSVPAHAKGLLDTPIDLLLWLLLGASGGGAIVHNSLRKKNTLDLDTAASVSAVGRFRTLQPQDADLSVFAPSIAAPDSDILIQVIVHTLGREAEARSRALMIEPTAAELASIPLTIPLNQRDNIRVTLDCASAKVVEPVQNTNWNGRMVCLYFIMHTPAAEAESILNATLRVFVNAVPAGFVVFKIRVAPNAPDVPLECAEQKGHPFKWAFMSYAHEDRVEVLKATQLISALHMRYYQDLLSESPGDRWEKRLFSEIEKCDVFLLFWSKHARDSEWVIKEAEYALQYSKSGSPDQSIEIVPILLEGPPPPLPPKSLQEIQFNDPIRYVIFAEESISKRPVGIPSGADDYSQALCRRPIQEHAITAEPPKTQSNPAVTGSASEKKSIIYRITEMIGPFGLMVTLLIVIILIVNLLKYV